MPGAPRLFVHEASGRSGRHVRALSGTSDWRRDLLDRAGVGALLALGSRRLRVAPALGWPDVDADALAHALQQELPGCRIVGAVTPRQADRARLSLLARSTGNPIVIKLGLGDGLEHERRVLDALARDPIPAIATPEPLASGTIGVDGAQLAFLATTAVELGHHRPALDEPLRTLEADLTDRLAELLGKGDDVPPGWVPVHGDLTPWNLRRTPRGLALFDWESAGWGPPGSDVATYRRACADVRPPWSRPRIGPATRPDTGMVRS